MALAAALIYWLIVAIWFGVLVFVAVAFWRNDDAKGTTRLLLIVVAIDAARNFAENIYFGVLWGWRYGLISTELARVLEKPEYLILPKILTTIAASLVLGLLLLRWLPTMTREQRDAEEALRDKTAALARETEEQRLLFELSVDLVMIVDRNGVTRRASRSVKSILGYDPDEVEGREGSSFADPAFVTRVREAVAELPRRGVIEDFTADFRHRNGGRVKIAFSGAWAEELDCALVIGRDVTEQTRAAERLEHLAHFDELSGLPNRVSLLRDLDSTLRGEEGVQPAAAVAIFDLDGFKDINNLLGHSTGDRVVQEIGARLDASASPACRVYRSGGDEFFMLMPGCVDVGLALEQVWSVVRKVEDRIDVDGYRLFVTARAGVALAPRHAAKADDLILDADLALHHAKGAEGRKVSVFEASMRSQARARQEIESELRQAVAQGEFVLHFQPQLRLRDRKVVGAEALLRWKHPERGLLAPAAFIEALSRSPAASEAGHFVLKSACMAAAAWHAKGLGRLRVGVNLFPIQFHSRTLLADVGDALAASGIEADQLELEITENIALGHDEEVLATLNGLRAQGIGIAFDDFGTGYASLSYLMRYPLTRLKIDRSFVQKIGDGTPSEENTAIVQSIIAMAHNIGLDVVAEGVETETQAAFLMARRCEEAQGYLFAKPLPFDDFVAFAARCDGGPTCCTDGAA